MSSTALQVIKDQAIPKRGEVVTTCPHCHKGYNLAIEEENTASYDDYTSSPESPTVARHVCGGLVRFVI